MKIKVKIFDKKLIKSFYGILSTIGVITSLLLIFITIPSEWKIKIGIFVVAVLIIIYFMLWIKANTLKKIQIKINNSKVNIKVGDIFNENSLKVIAFNEYFDTCVDEHIIASSTLNGKFIKNHVNDVEMLDNFICNDEHLSSVKLEKNNERHCGKKQKYKLGSICEFNNYLLTAFTKFGNNNRALLTMTDYVDCLLNFWNEIDIIYANRAVSIPLLGTGITRLQEYNDMTEQEKLEMLLWSFKVSRIKFTYPSEVTIVIHESIQDKIDFYKIKEEYNAL